MVIVAVVVSTMVIVVTGDLDAAVHLRDHIDITTTTITASSDAYIGIGIGIGVGVALCIAVPTPGGWRVGIGAL